MLFDPIHNLLGIGYYQMGHTVASYYYINYITFISFLALVSGIVILKWRHWKASERAFRALKENHRINRQLNTRNEELVAVTHEIEAQNEEILQQQEEMLTNQEMLEKANALVSQQKIRLEEYNSKLESLVEEKSGDLLKANEELIKSNNELRQFSFTVSHNLRGPVARLLGLTRLMDSSGRPEDLAQITSFISQSAGELDTILKDLSTIIDIRSELYRVREKISVREEWERALQLVGVEAASMAEWKINFSNAPYLYGIRPMVQSILYNLVSNAIKYQSPSRRLVLEATTRQVADQTVVEIKDNGLGIDLINQGENLFKLYRRFHLHVPGKGMGLYLVRSQMEIMNGRIEVESEPDQGTLFRLVFPQPADLDKQIFFENDSAQLYYDAHINNTVIIWRKNVTSEEYRQAFESVLRTIKKYNTPGWIADLRNQGTITKDDQQWFVQNVLKAAADNGLVRIAAIGFRDPVRKDYLERMVSMTSKFGIDFRMFEDMPAAIAWMEKFSR
jgi:signal transduction histidine kinase